MAQRSQFVICNDSFPALILNIEPEGVFLPLRKGEEVTVTDAYAAIPAPSDLPPQTRATRLSLSGPGTARCESRRTALMFST